MDITIKAGSPFDPEIQALTAALRREIPDARVMHRIKANDSGLAHQAVRYIADHGAEAAIYVTGVVSKKVVDVVVDWAKTTWFRKAPPGGSVSIYGPDGKVVKTIEKDRETT